MLGWVVIDGLTPTPIPVIGMETGDLNCVLAMEMLPDALPIMIGAKLAVKLALLPAAKVTGNDTPAIAKPVPVGVTCEIVTGVLPELVMVKVCLLAEPIATFPKFRDVGLKVIAPL